MALRYLGTTRRSCRPLLFGLASSQSSISAPTAAFYLTADVVVSCSVPSRAIPRLFHTSSPVFQSPMRSANQRFRNRTTMYYFLAVSAAALGVSYAAVPLYQVFCQVTGIGTGRAVADERTEHVVKMKRQTRRPIKVDFLATATTSINWDFTPTLNEMTVYPGETALAFFTAKNRTDRPITGIATYTVLPYEAALYFNKIQCFCFEEQRLNAQEEIDMPVFFYVDPEYLEDPRLEKVNTITLSYTFFEAKPGFELPMPKFAERLFSGQSAVEPA